MSKELRLINAKCNDIMQGLLAQHCTWYCQISNDCKETDLTLRRIEIIHYDLRVRFKEKLVNEEKVMCKENE